jgi:hypothetical protein
LDNGGIQSIKPNPAPGTGRLSDALISRVLN